MTNATAIDFTIRREQLFTKSGKATNRDAIIRNDTEDIVGIVSDSYNEIEYRPAFDAASKALDKVGGLHMKKLEVSPNGSRMFAHFEQEMEAEVVKGDIVKPTLILTNSLDGSTKFGFMLGAFRLVCSNGLMAGVSAMNISVKHTANLDIDEVAHRGEDALDLFTKKTLPLWSRMNEIKYATQYYIDEMLSLKNIIPQKMTERVAELANNKQESSIWEVYNHYTYHLTHEYNGSVDRRMELSTTIAKTVIKRFVK